MRLILGHLGSPYEGAFQVDSAVSGADVVAYFTCCYRLADSQADDATLHTPPRWLSPDGATISTAGVHLWDNPLDASLLQVGISFQLKTSLHVNIE